jgi:hypothetical protein
VPRSAPLLALVLGAALSTSSAAHADTSAWAAISAGPSVLAHDGGDATLRAGMAFDVGLGTSPKNALVFGGLFRFAPTVAEGTDLALLARGATRGFQTGDFGFAVDLGGYLRTFGPSSVTGGVTGGVVLGAPPGLQLSLLGHAGGGEAFGFSGLLGVDLLRLTVYRQSLLEWWPNPSSPSEVIAPPTTRPASAAPAVGATRLRAGALAPLR